MKYQTKKIVGYTDRFSVNQGKRISFMISCTEDKYEADIVHLRSRDNRAANGCFKEDIIEGGVLGTYCGRVQTVKSGSYGTVSCNETIPDLSSMNVVFAVWPTTPMKDRQLLISGSSECGAVCNGFALFLDNGGRVTFELRAGEGLKTQVSSLQPLRARQWYLIGAMYDGNASIMRLTVRSAGRHQISSDVFVTENAVSNPWHLELRDIHVAGIPEEHVCAFNNFNGKIDSPRIYAAAFEKEPLNHLLEHPLQFEEFLVAGWDFSKGIETTVGRDISKYLRDMLLINMPTRGMTGWNWDGTQMNWRFASDQYGAIHFHDDDLYDAKWKEDFAFVIPDDLPSGVYAARVKCQEDTSYIPFFVRCSLSTRRRRVAVLFPTASYIAYANQHGIFDNSDNEVMSGHLPCLREMDLFLDSHREYGYGLYDTHADGSGVCYSSRLRPILNMHPGAMAAWCGPGGNFPWQFPADLDIVDWLDAMNIEFDAITDEDLHAEGVGSISDYDVVFTGTHPEYISTEMWDAIFEYIRNGGYLMYLGGNGFYWRTAFHKDLAGVIEVRRAEDGVRNWISETGEYYHSFTGEYGGLWRRLGRPPQMLVGIGFCGQGFDYSSPYRRVEVAGEWGSFIFKGIDEEMVGGFGSVGGGAVGIEIDRFDSSLGSPTNAKVIATSLGQHGQTMFPCPSEVDMISCGLGGDMNPRVRADMVFCEYEGGGGVFSVGSIAFAGSLAFNNYENNVSKLTRNVVDYFLNRSRR